MSVCHANVRRIILLVPVAGATQENHNGSKGGKPRWVCLACRRSFGPTFGTAMYRLRTPPAEGARTLLVVMRRGSLSAAEKISGHNMRRFAVGCVLRPNGSRRLPMRWCMISTCPPSARHARRTAVGSPPSAVRCPPSPSEEKAAPEVVRQTRQRTHQQAGVSWISDGRAVYAREIGRTYRDAQGPGQRGRPRLAPTPGVGLTQVVKQRRQGRVVGVEVGTVLGEPVTCPYRVHVERLNGVLRDRLNALTRKTHAFAKDIRTWDALVTVCLFEHNGLRPHAVLWGPAEGLPHGQGYRRRTLAMAIGLTDHVWRCEEFLTFKHYHYPKG